MPDAPGRPTSVAVVPCYNEDRNPANLVSVLLSVPDLHVHFLDDASDGASSAVLRDLARSSDRVTVERNETRQGKAASLVGAMRRLDPWVQRLLLVDCDVQLSERALPAVLDELQRSDLVLANPKALARAGSFWERGAVFSANRHDRLRDALVDRYPARCANGRLFGMSRRLAGAIAESDVPRHTEDSHFMLVCLSRDFRYAYRRDAVLHYRAPQTLGDYLRQSNRFSEGRALLRERWPEEMLERYYDLAGADVARTFAAQAFADPLGACAFLTMLVAKAVQRPGSRTQGAAWAVAGSTKALQ
ncbi:MAG TPA: glycosyltransferase [Candidatus Baltobacteraceae bacterium]|jgi:cellulose synthase/poly-beta-1,6-N-acetylglucosamine synthase-like glycosyltransferase